MLIWKIPRQKYSKTYKKSLNKVEKTHLDNFVAGMNSDYATVSNVYTGGWTVGADCA